VRLGKEPSRRNELPVVTGVALALVMLLAPATVLSSVYVGTTIWAYVSLLLSE
jgi:hypothetical protein